MAFLEKTAFEVSVSNITRNNTQNVPGYYGAISDGTFTAADCSAGFLCKKGALAPSEGYESLGILNGNTWQFVIADDGAAAGYPGDHSGIYAFNSYNAQTVKVGDNAYYLGANTLGLGLPAGERGDFTEIIIGEQYTFAEGNFSTLPADATYVYAEIVNGLLVATDTLPTSGEVYFEILREKPFTTGNRYAGFDGYVCAAKRSIAA